MNFIIDFFNSKEYNVICIIVDKLSRKHYYEFCTTINENIFAEITAKILTRKIFRYHNFLIFITSNKYFQIIATV